MVRIKKRGQVSIFIILGLVILLSAGLFIFFRMMSVDQQADLESDELLPIKTYVEECVYKTASVAVARAGQQGGYINIPLSIDQNPSMYVTLDGMGIMKMPYWFYKGNKYNPSRVSIQNTLSKEIEENALKCINNFRPFKEQYTIIPLDKMKTSVQINKEDVSIMIEYPVKVSLKLNSTQKIVSKYYVTLPVRLGRVLEAADKILDAELNTLFLENFTIDLMAANPAIPLTDMDFSCRPKEWKMSELKKEMQEAIYENLPRIRIKNTNYHPFLEDESKYKELLNYHLEDIANGNYPENSPSDSYEYLHMFWDTGIEKDSTIAVGISSIKTRDIDMVGRPNDNGILRSKLIEGQQKFLKLFCMNMWHFTYDINYPAIITIRDDVSFGGKGYVFSFAMPVTIKNNEPYKGNYGYELFSGAYFEKGFCDETGDRIYDIRAIGSDEGYSNVELNDVNISTQCIKFYCPLGVTNPDEGSYRLRTLLPAACSSPFIIAEKKGYLTAKKQIDSNINQPFTIELTKIKKFDYDVVIHRYNSLGNALSAEEPFEGDMNLSIKISSGDFEQYKTYPIDYTASEDMQKIELMEDKSAVYDIEIILMQKGEYIGGYHGKWSPSVDEVLANDHITLHIVKYMPMPFSKEDKLKMMGYLMKGDYPNQLQPELKIAALS